MWPHGFRRFSRILTPNTFSPLVESKFCVLLTNYIFFMTTNPFQIGWKPPELLWSSCWLVILSMSCKQVPPLYPMFSPYQPAFWSYKSISITPRAHHFVHQHCVLKVLKVLGLLICLICLTCFYVSNPHSTFLFTVIYIHYHSSGSSVSLREVLHTRWPGLSGLH